MSKKKPRSRTAELIAMLTRLGVNQRAIAERLGITPGHVTRLKTGERLSDKQVQVLESMVDSEMCAVLREYCLFKRRSEMATESNDWRSKANPALLEMSEADLVQLLGTVGDSQDESDKKFADEIRFILKNRKPRDR
jgi:transcriptional regulator with XRE-family HTH domain